jgi:metal-dependent amidase/aminoacylase/carboxypeptidase family protein
MKTPELLKLAALAIWAASFSQAATLRESIDADYQENLKHLFIHFHENPELPFVEFETAKRMASELRALGYEILVLYEDIIPRGEALKAQIEDILKAQN